MTPFSFDISGLEIYLPLLQGGKVALASRDVAVDGDLLAARIAESGVTVMQATPATWFLLLGTGWLPTETLRILCGGEAFPIELAQALARTAGQVLNLYGPTETTIWSTVHEIVNRIDPQGEAAGVSSEGAVIPIGRPIANTQLYVLDASLRPVPIGVAGELFIGGVGVARGYHRRPDLTEERFIPNPFSQTPGSRLYRTGDVVRYRANGDLEFLGRTDHQVKIRGHRIELGEIEAAINEHPDVHQAVVVASQDGPGDQRLIAFVVFTSISQATEQALNVRSRLLKTLPTHMIPSAIVASDKFPLTPSGKVDRAHLSETAVISGTYRRHETSSPMNELESLIADVWSGLLQNPSIGCDDDFFLMGGHSLLAAQVTTRLRSITGRKIPIRNVFLYPTVRQYAEASAPSLIDPIEPDIAKGPIPIPSEIDSNI